MSNYIKVPLSARAGGKPIQITGTSLAGATLIHTAITGTSFWDEIWLWVVNVQATAENVTIAWGYDNTDQTLACKTVSVPANSTPILVCPGFVLQNARTLKAYAGTSGYINCLGFVRRI